MKPTQVVILNAHNIIKICHSDSSFQAFDLVGKDKSSLCLPRKSACAIMCVFWTKYRNYVILIKSYLGNCKKVCG